jgi:hypothetical protein
MENAMKKLLIAAVAAPVLLGSLPKAAPAAESGVLAPSSARGLTRVS